jgi:hypothetical protein
MRRGTLVLGLLLALTACSVTVTVDLPDQSLDLPGLADTGGKVVYPKDGLSFSPPPVDVVRGIRVEGVLEASEPLNITGLTRPPPAPVTEGSNPGSAYLR